MRILLKKTFFIIFLYCNFFFLTSCEIVKRYFVTEPDCSNVYGKVFEKGKKLKRKALFEGADNCLQKEKFSEAVFLFEKLLLNLKRNQDSIVEIKKVEKKLAEISFYKTENYEKAIKYYVDLLKKPIKLEEKFFFQKQISESFLYLKKYEQALKEVNKCFYKEISLKEKKEAVLLKSRILIEKKAFEQALSFFEKQMDKFPEEEAFFREYRAFIYETKKEFLSAIEELEKIEPTNLFIKKKIQKLRERQSNQPGF